MRSIITSPPSSVPLPATVSGRVRVSPFSSAPVGGATASTRNSLAVHTRQRAPSLACAPHSSPPPPSASGSSPEQLGELPARDRELMALVALRLSNDESADRLVVTPTTAETRVSCAMVKLHDRDDAQLVLFAYETGLALPAPNAQTPDRRPLSPGDMAPSPSIAEHLERQSVVPIESTIPTDMTAEQWRRQRSARPRHARRRTARLFAAARRLVPLRPVPCDHMHDTTTRYDHVKKLLSFLLVCPVCGTEKLVETKPYAPHFTPHPATQTPAASATVHRPPVRRRRPPLGRCGAGRMRPSATAAVHCRRTNGQPDELAYEAALSGARPPTRIRSWARSNSPGSRTTSSNATPAVAKHARTCAAPTSVGRPPRQRNVVSRSRPIAPHSTARSSQLASVRSRQRLPPSGG
jgi:DNA-binding CsgD family transcriptional regulator